MKLIEFKAMPKRMASHNAATFGRMVATLLENGGRASYNALAQAATGHVHGDKKCTEPAQFVDYCLRRGWITEQQTTLEAKCH